MWGQVVSVSKIKYGEIILFFKLKRQTKSKGETLDLGLYEFELS
jgi:hypothetical protein